MHSEYFLKNFGAFSEEKGEKYYQDINYIERRYLERWKNQTNRRLLLDGEKRQSPTSAQDGNQKKIEEKTKQYSKDF